jgi:hypothetical protein
VPDFLLVRANRTVQVVDVKPAAWLADPVVAEALAWPGELFEGRGWGHEIWTGADQRQRRPSRTVNVTAAPKCSTTQIAPARALLNYAQNPSSRCSSISDPYTGCREPIYLSIRCRT